ncbi:hypothetical protein ABIB15_001053 [Marisediminicola sp. UYEF4]
MSSLRTRGAYRGHWPSSNARRAAATAVSRSCTLADGTCARASLSRGERWVKDAERVVRPL